MKQGWEIKKLYQLFDVKSSRRVHQADWKSSGIPFYRAREVVKLAKDGMVENELFISQELYDELTKEKGAPKTGDIIVSAVGTLGQCYIVKDSDKFYFKDASVLWLENLGNVNSRYIEYAFKADSIIAQVMDGSMGATVGTLTISRAKDIEIPIPPLPEQQRIVAILDEAFAAIAKAKANAEQNLKNAKELFESYLQGVFENKSEGWEEKRFDEICVLQRGFDLPTHSRNEGSHPLVSSNGITDRIDLWKVKAPGVVTGRSGTIGNVHFIEEDYWPLNTALYIKEFHGNYERFIYFFLKQFDLGKYSSGAGVPTLNRNNVHSKIVWFPKSIEEQQTIVQKLDALSAETKKLEAIYQQKINDLEELKKSILQKAFSGELKTEKVMV
jgi:type I restriction enzyme S subunit